jgi:endonuclease-8
MPEGDTIQRAAAALRSALVDEKMVRFEAPRLVGITPRAGRVIESVESHGKHLEVQWDDGVILHTHMRMSGSWHLYRTTEIWQQPHHHLRALIEVEGWRAVCFNAPVVETYRAPDALRHRAWAAWGPTSAAPTPTCAVASSCCGPTTTPTRPSPRSSSTSGSSAASGTCSAARSCGPAS